MSPELGGKWRVWEFSEEMGNICSCQWGWGMENQTGDAETGVPEEQGGKKGRDPGILKRSSAAFSGTQKARKGADIDKPEAGGRLSAIFLWSRLEDAAGCGERREGGSER